MIFNSLKLENFGPFAGEHEIVLQTTPKKPIVLFGALNGSGKTTIFEGIQLALFGKQIKAAGKFKSRYDHYLKSLIYRGITDKDITSIQLSFKVTKNSLTQEVSIKREWFYDKRIKEKCNIYINGTLDENISARAEEFIQQIISPELSNLFFFDGEKIEALADPIRSRHLIAQGINDLLGVNTLDGLIKSLHLLERKKASALSVKQEEISLIEEQQKIEILDKNIKSVQDKIHQTKDQIDEKETEIINHNKVMSSSGAKLFKDREAIKADLQVLVSQKTIVQNKIQDLVAGDLPLLLVKDTIASIRRDHEEQSHYSDNVIKAIKKEVTEFSGLDKVDLSNKKRDDVLKEFFETLDKKNNNHPHLIDDLIIPDDEYLSGLKDKTSNIRNELYELDVAIDQAELKLNAIPEDGKVRDIIKKEQKLSDDLLKLKVKLNLYDTELLELTKQSEATNKILDQKIEDIAENEAISFIDRKVIQTSQKSRATLKAYKENLIARHINKINDQVGHCFSKIYRKSKVKLSFSINPEDFSISVAEGENTLPIDTLSSGERQILAISILWALSIISGKKMPILIDTPLARLDSKHRTALIRDYFPECSSQMLIFSTDEEIDKKYYPLIQNKTSHEYSILHDDQKLQSSFTKGYFEEVVNQ